MPTSASTPRFPLNHTALANYILLFFGTILTLAAIIFFFAYNWDALPKLAKLGIIQVGYLDCAICATLTPKRPLLSQTLLFASSIIVGVYLAVFGQIYQTGADPWQLFTLWAALIIPFALIAKNQPQWLVFATIAALGSGRFIYFYLPQYSLSEPPGYALQVLIPTLFFAAIWLKFERDHHTQNLPRPWSRPLLAAIIFAVLTIGTAISSHSLDEVSNVTAALAFYALLATATLGAWKQFGKTNFDINVLGIAALAWLLATSWTVIFALVLASVDPILIFALMAIYLIATSSFLGYILRQLVAQNPTNPPEALSTTDISIDAQAPSNAPNIALEQPQPEPESESESSRILIILSGTAGWLAAIFFMSSVLCAVGIDNSESAMLVIAIILSVVVIGFEFKIRSHETLRNSVFLDQTINATSLAAQALAAFYIFMENGPVSYVLPILGIAIFCAIHYAAIRSTELRFLSAATFLFTAILYLTLRHDFTNISPIIVPAALLAGLFFIALPYIKPAIVNTMTPAAYAAIIAVFVFHSIPEIFSYTVMITPIALVALALAVFENHRNPNARRLLIAATVLAALSFFADHTLLWAFTLLTVGLWRQRTPLTALGIVGFAFSLTVYYYNLHVTLLAKSGILLASGLLFIALFWFLELNKNNTQTPSLEVNP